MTETMSMRTVQQDVAGLARQLSSALDAARDIRDRAAGSLEWRQDVDEKQIRASFAQLTTYMDLAAQSVAALTKDVELQ